MQKSTHQIYTLHRERFILLILLGVFLCAFIAGQIEVSEVYKIIAILFCLPILLFLSITLSKNPSRWCIDSTGITIDFTNKEIIYNRKDIDRIQVSTRSGGSLISIFFNNKTRPKRYWSNKLFQKQDDIKDLLAALENENIPVLMQ